MDKNARVHPRFGRMIMCTEAASARMMFGLLFWAGRSGVEVYEHGLVLNHRKKREELPLESIRTFSASIVRARESGHHDHATATIVFAKSDGGTTCVGANIRKDDRSWMNACLHVGLLLAERLRQQVQSEGKVAWVNGVALSKQGIHASGKFAGGNAQEIVIPYAAVRRRRMDDFKLHLDGDNAGTPSELVIDCSEEGFFPGFGLVEQLAAA